MKTKQTLHKIFDEFLKTTGKVKFFFVVFFGLFVAGLSFMEPIFFTQIIKTIEEFLKTGNFDIKEFTKFMIYRGGFIIISSCLNLIFRYNFVLKLTLRNYTNLAIKYSKKIVNMTYPEYLEKEIGSIYKIFDRGLESQFEFFFFFFLDLIKDIGGIILVIIILFYYNIPMTLITLSLFPLMILFGILFYKKLYPLQKESDKEWESVYHDLGNSMSVFSLVKTLSIEKFFSNKMEKKLESCYTRQIKISKGWTIADLYTQIFTTVSRFFVLGAGVYYIMKGELDFATLFLFFSYIGWLYFPLGYLFGRLPSVQRWITASGRFYKDFDNLSNEHLINKGIKKDILGNIEFKNVSFGYNSKQIIKNLNLSIKKGDTIAFVGNTGAGKSTIINLLLRFWGIEEGEILVEGTNIKELNLKHYRKQIGIISQESSLFNMSIKQNLLLANPKATKNDIKEALKNAQANFVFKLEKGLNSVIGERGLKLSGGEKQRIAIARLFLKNPQVLILDEATSALDNKTEKKVQIALEKLIKGRTSIIIAHRLTTIKNVDCIYLLENGEIIESGNYQQLMDLKEKFYNLSNPDNLIIT